ncbi:MAG TPA: YgaP-like transmembrane domain [Actinomycetota bacterium]|nr:YgaP-like transmembrane domain [Actinomycetota bacterium]
MFPKNEGPADRAIRIVVGILLLPGGLFLLGGLGGSVVGLVVAAVGLLALVTGATGRCVVYIPFGITTLRERQEAPAHVIAESKAA